jgi:hypothetical protein
MTPPTPQSCAITWATTGRPERSSSQQLLEPGWLLEVEAVAVKVD